MLPPRTVDDMNFPNIKQNWTASRFIHQGGVLWVLVRVAQKAIKSIALARLVNKKRCHGVLTPQRLNLFFYLNRTKKSKS